MAKLGSNTSGKITFTGTGSRKGVKLSSMNKNKRRSYKKYRGQGKP